MISVPLVGLYRLVHGMSRDFWGSPCDGWV